MHSAIFIFLHLLCFPRSHVFGIICPIVAGIFDIHMSTLSTFDAGRTFCSSLPVLLRFVDHVSPRLLHLNAILSY